MHNKMVKNYTDYVKNVIDEMNGDSEDEDYGNEGEYGDEANNYRSNQNGELLVSDS